MATGGGEVHWTWSSATGCGSSSRCENRGGSGTLLLLLLRDRAALLLLLLLLRPTLILELANSSVDAVADCKEDIYFPNICLFLTLKSCEEPGGKCHVSPGRQCIFLRIR